MRLGLSGCGAEWVGGQRITVFTWATQQHCLGACCTAHACTRCLLHGCTEVKEMGVQDQVVRVKGSTQ